MGVKVNHETPDEDEVLKRMLKTLPKPHKVLPKEGRDYGNGDSDHSGDKR